MSKFKIAHILHAVGGVDISLRLIIKNTDPDRFEHLVVHGCNDTVTEFTNRNAIAVGEYKLPIARDISIVNDVRAIYGFYRIVKKERPEVIHAHSTKGGIIGRSVGMMTGTKVLFTPQAYSFLSTSNKLKRTVYRLIEKVFSVRNSTLLASSLSEYRRGISEGGYTAARALVFNNGINPIQNIEKLSFNRTWPDEYICTVGRPCYQKNILQMIRVLAAVNRHREVHLVLVGVGHHADQLKMVEGLISELGLRNQVTLIEWTAREDVLNIIKNARLYLSTARYEGLPYAVIESLSLSVPCVVSDCDGNRDLIVDGYNGFVVAQEDIEGYCSSILELMTNNLRHQEMAVNAQNSFSNYDISKRITDLEDIYIKANKV